MKAPLLVIAIVGTIACVALLPSLSNRQKPAALAFDPAIVTQDINWNEQRVAQDPKGAIGWSQLSAAYLRLSRLRDDNGAAVKAEEAARKSLTLRRSNNLNAALRLAQSILAQHRFTEALAATEDAMKIAPGNASARQLHTEILIELGRYDEARHEFLAQGGGASVVRARLLQLEGKTSQASEILADLAANADRNWDMSPDAKSWYHLKLGLALWDEGQASEAKQTFESAININPFDFKALAGMARLKAAQGDIAAAKEWASRSVSITPTVEAAALLEDIAAREGKADEVSTYRTLVDKVSHPDLYEFLSNPKAKTGAFKPHTHDRLYAMYLADHKRNLDDALRSAKKDMESRHDIYAFDTLAWVLHQMGRDQEAKAAMTEAMSQGTQDAKLYYHAGLIEEALTNHSVAEKMLQKALDINPTFQLGQADDARLAIERMRQRAKLKL